MTDFDKAFEIIIGLEGNYSNNPVDEGGETKYGISHRSYPNLKIKKITLEDAKIIYERDYWDRCKCDQIPYPLNILVFDCAVNQGKVAAIRTLQRAVGVTVDGIIGTQTLKAASKATSEQIALFMAYRAHDYASYRGFETFGLGWMKRLFKIMLYL